MKLAFATQNPFKLKEVAAVYAHLGIEIVSMGDLGLHDDIVEDQDTYEGNALLKARFVCERAGLPTIADDSGVNIDALDGRPGIYSARWAGEGADGRTIVDHTLAELTAATSDVRTAQFVTCAVLVMPDGSEFHEFGKVHGRFITEPKGEWRDKFPYDMIFVPDEGDGRTFSEMTLAEKYTVSHRERAFRALEKHVAGQLL